MTVDFNDAIAGVTVGMQMVSDSACPTCHGTGAKAGTVPHVCPICEGSGMQTSTSGGVFAVTEPCRECRGRGMVVDDPVPGLPRIRTRPVHQDHAGTDPRRGDRRAADPA